MDVIRPRTLREREQRRRRQEREIRADIDMIRAQLRSQHQMIVDPDADHWHLPVKVSRASWRRLWRPEIFFRCAEPGCDAIL